MPGSATPRIVITPGEPAGVGPDLCLQLAQQAHDVQLVAVCDPDLLAARAAQLGLSVALKPLDLNKPSQPQKAKTLDILPVRLAASCVPGKLDARNADYVLQCLRQAVDGCLQQQFAAMVTGPVHKGIINEAGWAFTGHTEFLAERCAVARPVMMLQTEGLRVALATTHLPLREVPDAITADLLQQVIEILQHDFRAVLGITNPVIYVCGLNPHAGEMGHLGKEEQQIIEPLLNKLRQQGINLIGPLPADTIFTPEKMRRADVFLAMYHDQGLAVLKHVGFGNAVNVTLGLPVIRTSVDHGTALDLAGTGKAHVASFAKALQAATSMVHSKQRVCAAKLTQ